MLKRFLVRMLEKTTMINERFLAGPVLIFLRPGAK